MSIKKPYFRTCRQFVDSSYAIGGKSKYIKLPEFSSNASHYIRAFLLIQKDLLNLFDYIEPSDQNLKTYSFRVHELLFRACVEVEANFKAILRENGYERSGDWNMSDYKKIEASHNLSQYQILVPSWIGENHTISPFESFKEGNKPVWYEAYNSTKHNRQEEFSKANFKNLIGAITGLLALLSSQFYTYEFSGGSTLLAIENEPGDDTESAIGGYFRVRFPQLPIEERYDFEWKDINSTEFSFVQYPYLKNPKKK